MAFMTNPCAGYTDHFSRQHLVRFQQIPHHHPKSLREFIQVVQAEVAFCSLYH